MNHEIKPTQAFTLGIILDSIQNEYPELKFWDGVGKHENYQKGKSYLHRAGMPNEIRIEFDSDNREENMKNSMLTAHNLYTKGYSFAVFYTEGGRSPHIHLYDIDELECLDAEQRTKYRELFLKRHCPINSNPDKGLCDEKHLCALEFVNHFKYGKPKRLLHYFFQGWNQMLEYDLKLECLNRIGKSNISQNKLPACGIWIGSEKDLFSAVKSRLTFESIFDHYKVRYRGKMAYCPFHNDSNASLSFSNDKKLFYCWGCHAKGDIITMIKYLEKVKK